MPGRWRACLHLAITQGGGEGHLEPEQRAKHEEEEERRPAEVDTCESSVGGAEALMRPVERLQDEPDYRDEQGDQPLEPPLLPPERAVIGEAEPHEDRAQGVAGDDG